MEAHVVVRAHKMSFLRFWRKHGEVFVRTDGNISANFAFAEDNTVWHSTMFHADWRHLLELTYIDCSKLHFQFDRPPPKIPPEGGTTYLIFYDTLPLRFNPFRR